MSMARLPDDSVPLVDRLKKRYNAAKSIADLWLSVLQASFHYAVPFRDRFYMPSKDFQGTLQNTRLFDTTAVEATKTFVSKIQDTMTPPGVQWGYLEVDEDKAKALEWSEDDIDEAQMVLNDYMRRLFTYIHRSNFDVVINECYFDLAVGTSCLVINQNTDENPFLCTSIPIDKLSIEEAADGYIRSWYRTWENLKISELHLRWRNIVLSPTLLQMLMADPDATVRNLYEGVAYFPGSDKPYCYAVWEDSSTVPLVEQWEETSVGIVWRFQKINNETWGRGPVMDALPTIISLNEIERIKLASANLNTFKPYMGFSDNVFNPHTFTLEPFSIIPIAPLGIGQSPPLIPLPSSADPGFGENVAQDLRLQILRLMYAEQPSDSMSVQPQTAFELAQRQQALAEKIGPLFSRLESEFLRPVIARFSSILHNMGLLLRPELNGMPISFKYASPLALAKGQQLIARFTQYVQLMQGTMGAEMTQIYVNPKTTPYLLAEALEVDPRFLNTPDAVARVMQQVQNKQSMIDAGAMTPEQPESPIQQPVQ